MTIERCRSAQRTGKFCEESLPYSIDDVDARYPYAGYHGGWIWRGFVVREVLCKRPVALQQSEVFIIGHQARKYSCCILDRNFIIVDLGNQAEEMCQHCVDEDCDCTATPLAGKRYCNRFCAVSSSFLPTALDSLTSEALSFLKVLGVTQ